MNWFNYYGLIFVAVILIPNVIFAIKCKDGFENKWKNKAVETAEQIGRFGSFIFMIFNIPKTYFGFWFDGGFIAYIVVESLLAAAYCALDPEMRKDGVEVAKPITVGNNVWFGANVTVLAGVEIGDNAVIGAGSVVTKSIPANVVAVGVPCKPIREITSSDKETYPYHESLKR